MHHGTPKLGLTFEITLAILKSSLTDNNSSNTNIYTKAMTKS